MGNEKPEKLFEEMDGGFIKLDGVGNCCKEMVTLTMDEKDFVGDERCELHREPCGLTSLLPFSATQAAERSGTLDWNYQGRNVQRCGVSTRGVQLIVCETCAVEKRSNHSRIDANFAGFDSGRSCFQPQ